MPNIEQMLDGISGTLINAFGDRVIIGVLIRLLDDITPGKAYEAIITNKDLFENTTNDEWDRWKQKAKHFHIMEITHERAIAEINKRRPDLIGIIINTPGGNEWIKRQIDFAKEKLGI